MKYCPECRTKKPRKLFYGNKAKKDGLAVHCKKCAKVRKKDDYLRNNAASIMKRLQSRMKEISGYV